MGPKRTNTGVIVNWHSGPNKLMSSSLHDFSATENTDLGNEPTNKSSGRTLNAMIFVEQTPLCLVIRSDEYISEVDSFCRHGDTGTQTRPLRDVSCKYRHLFNNQGRAIIFDTICKYTLMFSTRFDKYNFASAKVIYYRKFSERC